MHEGKLTKKISSRVSEAIVLQQFENFEGKFDEIHYYGTISEDFKDTMKKVGKKIVPAAMAAGIAMGAADATAGSRDQFFPGANANIGSLISDIFSPNYQQLKRERDANKRVEKRAWEARRREIDRARVRAARDAGKAEAERLYGQPKSSNRRDKAPELYLQARLSKNGKVVYLYKKNNGVTTIRTKDLEWIEPTSKRAGHYLNSSGKVYYVQNGVPLPEGRGRNTHAAIKALKK
jgi:hypothetical protein